MNKIPKLSGDLQWTHADRERHIAALIHLRSNENDHQRQLFDFFYQALNILDSKTSNLMRFNSIQFAICSLLISPNIKDSALQGDFWSTAVISIAVGAILSFISAFILLTVIWVHWSETDDLTDAQSHLHRLLSIRNSRTRRYRIAWMVSMLSLLGLSIHLVVVGYRVISV